MTVFASRDWFRLAYCHSILLLYRHCLTCMCHCRPDEVGAPCCTLEITEMAFQECADRAREMCLLYRRTYQNSPVRYTWGSLHILFLAGLTYLHCIWNSASVRKNSRQIDVINTCTACTMVLVIIAERYRNAKSYRDIFEQLAERTITMICRASEVNQSGTFGTTIQGPAADNIPYDSTLNTLAAPTPLAFEMSYLDDWITNLEQTDVHDESEWLVQDLIRGFSDRQGTVSSL